MDTKRRQAYIERKMMGAYTLPAPKKNGMLPGGKLPNTTLAPIRMRMAMRSIRMEYDVLYWGAQKVMAKTAPQ